MCNSARHISPRLAAPPLRATQHHSPRLNSTINNSHWGWLAKHAFQEDNGTWECIACSAPMVLLPPCPVLTVVSGLVGSPPLQSGCQPSPFLRSPRSETQSFSFSRTNRRVDFDVGVVDRAPLAPCSRDASHREHHAALVHWRVYCVRDFQLAQRKE